MADNKLLLKVRPAHSLGDLLQTRGSRPLVTIGPDATAAAAIEAMQKAGISQLPVVQDGKPVGAVQEVTLARMLHDNCDPNVVTVGEIMARPLPALDVTVHLDEAYRLLMAGHTGVLALANGKVVDIVTRIDLVQYWQSQRKE
ncbi:MAG: CBS domain-containing protein [Gemmataceae bacterium]